MVMGMALPIRRKFVWIRVFFFLEGANLICASAKHLKVISYKKAMERGPLCREAAQLSARALQNGLLPGHNNTESLSNSGK